MPLEIGLRATFNWYLRNDWWWQSVMDRSYQEWIRGHYGAGYQLALQTLRHQTGDHHARKEFPREMQQLQFRESECVRRQHR